MIDDLEDGNHYILRVEGRTGSWFTFGDGSPRAVVSYDILEAKRTSSSVRALNAWGDGFVNWGAGVGFNLLSTGRAYDAAKYSGVTFWAKREPGSAKVIRFNIVDKNTTPEGGSCQSCWDHFGRWIVLTDKWQEYKLKWSDFAQQGWGDPYASITPGALYSMHFAARSYDDFDFWIDDIAFF
jgi:hypothetical protein